MAGKILNKDKYNKAIEEYLKGDHVTITELSKKYDFDRASFSRYLKKQNIEVRKTSSTKKKIYNEAMKEYKNSDSTLKDICNKYNINMKNFSLYLKNNKVEVKNGFSNKRYGKDENFFEEIDSEEKAYWLGFIFADGCIVNNELDGTYRILIELAKCDENHLIKFKNDIKSTAPIAYRKDREMCSITINSKKIVEDLIKLGAVVNKTELGFISKEILQMEEHLKLAFLRGYIDGDGYIDKTRNRIVITIKTLSMSSSLKSMFEKYSFKLKNDISYYRLIIENKTDFHKLLNDIYGDANIYLNRKYNIYTKRCAVLG